MSLSYGVDVFALNFGIGKQKKKNGNQLKMMSNRMTKMITNHTVGTNVDT
jgi:hypothetical protein